MRADFNNLLLDVIDELHPVINYMNVLYSVQQ